MGDLITANAAPKYNDNLWYLSDVELRGEVEERVEMISVVWQVPKKSQFSLKRKKSKDDLELGDLVCPLHDDCSGDITHSPVSPLLTTLIYYSTTT